MYGSVYGFFQRNPTTQVTSLAAAAYYLADASVALDTLLGDRFPVPFSSNNQLVNTLLVYDLAELRQRNRDGRGGKAEDPLRTAVNSLLGALRDGSAVMLQASSITPATGSADTLFYGPYTRLQAAQDLVPAWMQVYTNRGGYLPTFTEGDWITQQVDPNLIQQQLLERGLTNVGSP